MVQGESVRGNDAHDLATLAAIGPVMLTVMPQATREPREVLRRISLRFQGANIPHRQQAEALLAWAWFNLDALRRVQETGSSPTPPGSGELLEQGFDRFVPHSAFLVPRGPSAVKQNPATESSL
jgi:hypothetical protein